MDVFENNSPNLLHNFTLLPGAEFRFQKDKHLMNLLNKWGLLDMQLVKFKSDRNLVKGEEQSFIEAFFKSDDVKRVLRNSEHKNSIQNSPLSTKHTTLALFRPLETHGIVSATGRIAGRLEEDYEGVPLYDKLRECLVCEESEIFEIFGTEDRAELLFHVFRAVVLGGAMNQYEENISDYFTVTKTLYRDLVSVRRNASNDVEVVTRVFDVSHNPDFFARPHKANFLYLLFDPNTREVTLWQFQHRALFSS